MLRRAAVHSTQVRGSAVLMSSRFNSASTRRVLRAAQRRQRLSRHLSTLLAARCLGISTETLVEWTSSGVGPPSERVGRYSSDVVGA